MKIPLALILVFSCTVKAGSTSAGNLTGISKVTYSFNNSLPF